LLQRAKIDPAGMITFFERLSEKDEGRMEWLSTHPMSAARAERLKAELAALPKKSPEPYIFDSKQVQAGQEQSERTSQRFVRPRFNRDKNQSTGLEAPSALDPVLYPIDRDRGPMPPAKAALLMVTE
jgi:predicted Zn-dependent protease